MLRPASPSRGWFWLQVAIGWLPMWALFTLMIMSAHQLPYAASAWMALRMIGSAAVLGLGVHAFTRRQPWPFPFRWSFLLLHALAAALYAGLWISAYSVIESLVRWRLAYVDGPGVGRFALTGIWLYLTITAVAYAQQAAQRSALVQAAAARAQLAALHAQLHPHFLFNALHTVVQLIPLDPAKAAEAAEQLAELLRAALDERRDQVSLAEEWRFVQRYLAIEALRFGERLKITATLPDAALGMRMPSFALQTLVENAVRHGAAPKLGKTHLQIRATASDHGLSLVVSDDGAGAEPAALLHGGGTGLRRLRERLACLYGNSAELDVNASLLGVTATLRLPGAARHAKDDEPVPAWGSDDD
ncbi:MAG: histidine kinase [Bdellovibrionales bacterium]|nr:histidine kinase [Massilia sp.]